MPIWYDFLRDSPWLNPLETDSEPDDRTDTQDTPDDRPRSRWHLGKPPGSERCEMILCGGEQCPRVAIGAADWFTGERVCLGHQWAADEPN